MVVPTLNTRSDSEKSKQTSTKPEHFPPFQTAKKIPLFFSIFWLPLPAIWPLSQMLKTGGEFPPDQQPVPVKGVPTHGRGRSWMISETPSNPNCSMINQSRHAAMIFLTLPQLRCVSFGTYFSVYFHTLISLVHFALGYQNSPFFLGLVTTATESFWVW